MKAFHILLTLLLTFVAVLGEDEKMCAKEGSSRSSSIKIKKKILCNYDKEYRPIKNQKEAVSVNFRLIPRYFDVNSDLDATMEVQNWLGVVWKDEFLTWNPADYDSVKNVHITSNEIWTPDLKPFKQERSDDVSMFDGASCLVSNTGYVSCVIENEHLSYCSTDVLRWPYDTRTCELLYTTGVYNSSQIKIKDVRNRLVMDGVQPNTEWELTNASVDLSTYKAFDQTYELVTYVFKVRRHSSRTTAIIIIPAFSLIVMTLVPLWMQPGNTERFCLIAANILTHFLFIQHISWIVPALGTKLPPAITFFRDSLGLAIVVLIELTLVKSLLAGKTVSPTWLLAPCKLVASGVIGKTILTEDVQEEKDEETIIQNDIKESKTKQIQGDRCLIVAVLDRILFFVLSLAYFVLVMLFIPFN